MLCTCNCMFVCFLSDLLIVSLKKNEKVGQLLCVCVFLFFSGIAPAILEAQTWSHFELGGKKETSPYHPCPNAHLAKCIHIPFCIQWIPQKIGLISGSCIFLWSGGNWFFFLQRTQELEKGGGEGHGAVGYRTGCAHVGGQKSSRKKIELFWRSFERYVEAKGLKK